MKNALYKEWAGEGRIVTRLRIFLKRKKRAPAGLAFAQGTQKREKGELFFRRAESGEPGALKERLFRARREEKQGPSVRALDGGGYRVRGEEKLLFRAAGSSG